MNVIQFYLESLFVQGEVCMGLRPALPWDNVSMILGNDLPGCKVWPGEELAPKDMQFQGDVKKRMWEDSVVSQSCAVSSLQSQADSSLNYSSQDGK